MGLDQMGLEKLGKTPPVRTCICERSNSIVTTHYMVSNLWESCIVLTRSMEFWEHPCEKHHNWIVTTHCGSEKTCEGFIINFIVTSHTIVQLNCTVTTHWRSEKTCEGFTINCIVTSHTMGPTTHSGSENICEGITINCMSGLTIVTKNEVLTSLYRWPHVRHYHCLQPVL